MITKTITQPIEVIEEFADKLGYQAKVINPDYAPGQGQAQIIDPNWVKPTEWDESDIPPMVYNPDYIPPVGEPTKDNPQTRLEFVSEKFDEMATKWFTQFAEKEIRQSVENTVKQQVNTLEQQIKSSISTQF